MGIKLTLMKKILYLAAFISFGALTSCGNGSTETKPAADSSAMKKDTTAMPAAPAMVDTTKTDTSKKNPVKNVVGPK